MCPAKTHISLGIWVFTGRTGHLLRIQPSFMWTAKMQMPRLIWVFARHTGHLVGFVVQWHICQSCMCSRFISSKNSLAIHSSTCTKVVPFSTIVIKCKHFSCCQKLQINWSLLDKTVSMMYTKTSLSKNTGSMNGGLCRFEQLSFELPHDKTNKMACVPSEDLDQPGHPPSLVRVFAVRSLGS